MGESNKFWEKTLLNNIVHLHRVIPTLMYTVVNDSFKDNTFRKYYSMCCVCERSVIGEVVAFGVRCLIAKFQTFYISSFVYANICRECSIERKIHCIMDSDQDMINLILDKFEESAADISELLEHVDIHAEHFFQCIINRMKVQHPEVMKSFLRLGSTCMQCMKRKAKTICKNCFY
jgi:hypothetical protein